MDELAMSSLLSNSTSQITSSTRFVFKRYLYDDIFSSSKDVFVGIYGLRGIGKTALMLQTANALPKSVYFSADAHYLSQIDLYDLVKTLSMRGFENIFIDEIQAFADWKTVLKTAYDESLAKIYFSGSSAIELKTGADLSRRALLFNLLPVSFREYLCIKKGIHGLSRVDLQQITNNKSRQDLMSGISPYAHLVSDYYSYGGVAFSSVNPQEFELRISNTLDRILFSDLALVSDLKLANVEDARKLLQWIAISPAGEASYSSLASKLSISKPTVIRIIDSLCRIGLILKILSCGKDLIRKEPKLYLAPSFRSHIAKSVLRTPDLGALREEFFAWHALDICYMKGSRGQKTPDFNYKGQVFEVGGEGKKLYQNPDYIVNDGLEFTGNHIPLSLFGFLR